MPPETSALSLATYNIHRCIGTDGRKAPERIAAMLHELSCDLVGLQEVESLGPRGGDAHQLDYLASICGYRSVDGPTMKEPGAQYGNALLTRGKVHRVRRHAFAVSRWEPRGILEAWIEVRGIPIHAVVTHLGLRSAERREQVTTLLEIVGAETKFPAVILGDFNEWVPWARSRRRLSERFGRIPMPPTFPSRRPLFALDHIWVRPVAALSRLESVRTPLSRIASDHLPLRAVIRVARGDSAGTAE
jgi:endonuclease/exonuclease/phosphatase family metal-dependent hydrolase